MGEIRRFLSFYVKISQNWLKFLSCTQDVTKKLIFRKLFPSFVEQNDLNAIFGQNE